MRRTRSRRIQTTIAFAFAVLVLTTALVMAVLSYSFTQEAVLRTSLDFTGQLITQVQKNIDSYIEHMQNIAEVVQVNEDVQTFLAAGPRSDDLARQITAFLSSVSRTRDDISLILIATEDGRVVTHDPLIRINPAVEIARSDVYRAAVETPGTAVVSSSHVQNIVAGEYRWAITLSRTIDAPAADEPSGVLLVDLTFSVINELVSRISPGRRGYLFIVDASGGIVYHPRQELIYSGLEREYIDRVLASPDGSFTVVNEREERIYTVSTSRATGWRIVAVNYATELVRNRAAIRRTYTYGAVASAIAALVIAVLISHRISRPILRLRSSMQAVERGDFDISVDVRSNNEIGDLARDFSIMVARIRELVRRNTEEHELKRRSELLALQNQITPHFLYNTLDSVIWMAEGRQYDNVVTTVAALARLLRLSINRGDELISIHDEIEHIKSYLTIQKLRYRDRLDFTIDVDESILRLRTPKVILQPLVENAIYHGIKNKEGGGRVAISGGSCDSTVTLSVADDGVGMSDQVMANVLSREHADDGSRRSRVGVRNVHERIQLYFGAGYGVAFRHKPGGGTVVDVRLPVLDQEGRR